MKKFLQKKLKNEKGMTLIELLAVIVIIAIIAAIAIPAIGNIIQNSRNGAVKADFQNALAAANIYFTENEESSIDVQDLLDQDYLDDAGSLSTVDGEVVITEGSSGASNVIKGKATSNGDAYEIKNSLTNAQLNDIKNANFEGTSIAPE